MPLKNNAFYAFPLRLVCLPLLACLLLAACAADPNPPAATSTGSPARTTPKPATSTPAPSGVLWSAHSRELPPSYTASFMIQFSGPVTWKYSLQLRKTPALSEKSLHIDGLDRITNPGDLRSVSDGLTTWMSGESTDQECVQFPNNQGLDPKWILPESMVSPAEVSKSLKAGGEETIAGRPSVHYSGSAARIGYWQDARFEVWLDKANQALLQFEMIASGDDEFFWTGKGSLYARYSVESLASPKIESISGCQLSVPLPETAERLVRLPGLASFESKARGEDLRVFYQERLPKDGWKESEPAAQNGKTIVMSYQKGSEKVHISIEPAPSGSGSLVKLNFITDK